MTTSYIYLYRRNAHVRHAREIRDGWAEFASSYRTADEQDKADAAYQQADRAEIAAWIFETKTEAEIADSPAVRNFVTPYYDKLEPPRHWNGALPTIMKLRPISVGRHLPGSPDRKVTKVACWNFLTDEMTPLGVVFEVKR